MITMPRGAAWILITAVRHLGHGKAKSDGGAPHPFMILKDFQRGYGKSFMIMEVAPVEQHLCHDHLQNILMRNSATGH
jgi:hypothetical protein